MAIQQMGLMHYRAPPAGGGADSAYLPDPIALVSVETGVNLTFYDTNFGDAQDTGRGTGSLFPITFTWKTGPNAASDYEVNYIKTLGIGNNLGNATVNTWYTLGTADTPSWGYSLGGGQNSSGYLVIRNISNPGVELANVAIQFSADPNA